MAIEKKNELRSRIRRKRRNLPEDYIESASEAVNSSFLATCGNHSNFLFYYSFDNEIKTQKLIADFYKKGKKIYLPKITDGNIELGIFQGEENMQKGAFGIMEPVLTAENITTVDVVVVPGLVFDMNCNRIGFGKGFYDKILAGITCKQKVGFAYDFQVMEYIETEEHDIPLDIIITEKKIYRRK